MVFPVFFNFYHCLKVFKIPFSLQIYWTIGHDCTSLLLAPSSIFLGVQTNEIYIVINLYYKGDDSKLFSEVIPILHSSSSSSVQSGVIVNKQWAADENLAPFGPIGLSNLAQEFRVIFSSHCYLFK